MMPRLITSLICVIIMSGCAVTPTKLDNLGQDTDSSFKRKVIVGSNQEMLNQHFLLNAMPLITPARTTPARSMQERTMHKSALQDLPLSFLTQTYTRGDVLRVSFMAMPNYNGLYQINENGKLELPFSQNIIAEGQTRNGLIAQLKKELVRLNWFYKDNIDLDISLVRQAAITVSVSGAVFVPGAVSINNQPVSKAEDNIQQLSGEYSNDRNVISALVAAGGVRPDADLNHVYLKRDNTLFRIPLNEFVRGKGFVKTPTLINGDTIFVRSSGVEDVKLITPTAITPPGMRVFMSNLTAPALNNSQAAVGADSTRLPYGSSLLDAAISANCIGGTHQANASRSVVLVTKNHGGEKQMIVRRSINQMLAASSDHSVNPYVMPNDGLACYDSRFTNFRDVARGIGELISPILLGRLL